MNFVYSLHCKLYIILFRHGNSPYAKIINFVKLLNYHSWSFNSHSLSFIVIHGHSIVKLLYCLLATSYSQLLQLLKSNCNVQSTANCQLHPANCILPTASCQLPPANSLLPTFCVT